MSEICTFLICFSEGAVPKVPAGCGFDRADPKFEGEALSSCWRLFIDGRRSWGTWDHIL